MKATGPMKVGILVPSNLATFMKSIDNDPAAAGDPEAAVKAVVAAVNANGGLGGRPLEPVFARFDTASSQPFAVQHQAICNQWTQDTKVEVALVVGTTVASSELPTCLTERNVLVVTQGSYPDDAEVYERLQMVSSAGVSLTRAAKPLVDGLKRASFFAPGAKVGLVRYDLPESQRAVTGHLKPALAEAGATVAEEAIIPFPNGPADIQPIFARTQSSVVKFRDAGITHVVMYGPATFFMAAAERQQYRPKYGISSLDAPVTLPMQQISKNQLQNAVGVGWYPVLDVDAGHEPSGNPGIARCKDILKAKGIQYNGRTADLFAYSYCDAVFLIEAATDGSPGATGKGLLKAIESLGTSYRSPLSLQTRLGPDRHDGGAAVRDLRYQADCSCFAYVGPALPI